MTIFITAQATMSTVSLDEGASPVPLQIDIQTHSHADIHTYIHAERQTLHRAVTALSLDGCM